MVQECLNFEKKSEINEYSFVSTKLVREANTLYSDYINSPEDIRDVLTESLDMENLDREHFVLICLDRKNRINAISIISIGGLSSTIVHPREVFKTALLASANALVLAHNHPSGDATPSPEDIKVTEKLIEVGNILGIPVLDHIVIGLGTYTSLKARKYI